MNGSWRVVIARSVRLAGRLFFSAERHCDVPPKAGDGEDTPNPSARQAHGAQYPWRRGLRCEIAELSQNACQIVLVRSAMQPADALSSIGTLAERRCMANMTYAKMSSGICHRLRTDTRNCASRVTFCRWRRRGGCRLTVCERQAYEPRRSGHHHGEHTPTPRQDHCRLPLSVPAGCVSGSTILSPFLPHRRICRRIARFCTLRRWVSSIRSRARCYTSRCGERLSPAHDAGHHGRRATLECPLQA